jgi:hypothetical protein
MRAVVMALVVVMTYRRRFLPGSDEAKTEGLKMSPLRLSSALCVSFHPVEGIRLFNNLCRRNKCSPSWDMKMLGLLLSSYLMMLLGARKHLGKLTSRMLISNALWF